MSGLGGRYILPTQLYSIVFNVLLGTLLLALYVSGEAESSFIVGLYFILTGIERFAEDAYRGEKQTRWRGPLRENQWIALASMIAGVAVTLIPSATPPAPDYGAFGPVFVLAMVLGGLLGAFAMSMDFPKATFRYSRLSG
jgi:prolipoprotein diacylglyceryltransferase